ncbi:MAG: DEAD/DEAH box helicase [Verrucomicrobia bacterium]|nr:DEAD/DEAH box helicase [Verrucomicrobiota bacterium]MCH8511162.1 DEAD/DEAH box helicase [Kiritimatiellia bacterium]
MKYAEKPRHERRAERSGSRSNHRGRNPGRGASAKPAPVALTPEPPRDRKVTPEGEFKLLIPELEQALAEEGYLTPSPVQAQAIAPILEGRDMIGTAQTGTGKTAAFLLPILQRLHANAKTVKPGYPRVVILSPTRELAAQIGESVRTYGRHLALRHTVITGGVSPVPQTRALRQGVDIVVATPGRFLDLNRQKKLFTEEVEVFILDEVDRMLDMGFLPDIKSILKNIPPKRQSLFFSATLSPVLEELAGKITQNPVRVSIAPEKTTVDKISQSVLFVDKSNKNDLLLSLFDKPEVNKVMVFTQMKHMANKVTEHLSRAGIKGAAIHGNKSQAARTAALNRFTRGEVRVLVATDVAARGIDVDGITHVVNYDLPIEAENYVHRIGRTARAGASGTAISFCSAQDRNLLRGIERLLENSIPVDEDHAWHCETSRHARGESPMMRGRGGRGGGGGGGPRGRGGRGAPRGRR